LVANNGLEAVELMKLAHLCVQADPQSWGFRELLGAALYCGGQPAQGVRELDEAARLHGSGSLWAKVLLALAHLRLGHTDQVRALRTQVQNVDSWEEQLILHRLLRELDIAKPVPP
jgi:hypothetical protein